MTGRHDVGHFSNATGLSVLTLSSSISVVVWTPLKENHLLIHLTTFKGGREIKHKSHPIWAAFHNF